MHLEILWVVTPYSAVVEYHRFTMKMVASRFSETLVSYRNTTRHRSSEGLDFNDLSVLFVEFDVKFLFIMKCACFVSC
jgi:hypothetical protein